MKYHDKLNYSDIAQRKLEVMVLSNLQGGIIRYINHGIDPGHFMSAVISNDLKESLNRADENSRKNLFDIVSWFYNYAPHDCWGSKERFNTWRGIYNEEMTDA